MNNIHEELARSQETFILKKKTGPESNLGLDKTIMCAGENNFDGTIDQYE